MQQMRLAEAGIAVNEQRVVGLRRCLGDSERRRVREAVAGANHECLEGVLRVKPGLCRPPGDLPRQRRCAGYARRGPPVAVRTWRGGTLPGRLAWQMRRPSVLA